MTPELHTHVFGPAELDGDPAPTVLALHGLTGHGKRWGALADGHLPGVRVVAPDLLGHGHSPAAPPWSIEAHTTAVIAAAETHIPAGQRPVVVLAHSFGSTIALTLARQRPDLVKALVLLDPAQGLPPDRALEMALGATAHRGYPDAGAAVAAKRAEGWGAVPDDVLERELIDHLVSGPAGVDWRVCLPTAIAAWSEMARPAQLPPAGMPTRVVVADRVQPPFVTPDFLARCAAERPEVRVTHVDTEHMVPYLAPETVAALVREVL